MKNTTNYLKIFKQNYKFFIVFPLLTLAIALIISAVQTPKYESQMELLVIQKQNDGLDAYTAAKASEKLGTNLSKVVYTTSFLDKVASQPDVDLSFLPTTEKERRLAWKKTISAQTIPESSMLQVTAYSPNAESATKLVQAVSYVLANESKDYLGSDNAISIQVVNTAMTSKRPVQPNYLLNMVIGILSGVIVSAVILIAREALVKLFPAKYTKKSAQTSFAAEYQILDQSNVPSYDTYALNNAVPKSMFDHLQ